jgi:hypothetical protein
VARWSSSRATTASPRTRRRASCERPELRLEPRDLELKLGGITPLGLEEAARELDVAIDEPLVFALQDERGLAHDLDVLLLVESQRHVVRFPWRDPRVNSIALRSGAIRTAAG